MSYPQTYYFEFCLNVYSLMSRPFFLHMTVQNSIGGVKDYRTQNSNFSGNTMKCISCTENIFLVHRIGQERVPFISVIFCTQCAGFTTSPGIMVNWCCMLSRSVIQYRQPGDMVLYYQKETPVTCQTGWTGDNCDSCAPGWTGDDCDTCVDGWLPPTCDQICDGFGCCNQGECQGCIQNGKWVGEVDTTWWGKVNIEVRLTFAGETCSEIIPG